VKSIAPCLRVAVSLFVAGCGGAGAQNADASTADRMTQEPMPIDVAGNTDATVVEGGACTSIIEEHALEGYNHIPCTMPASYLSTPPSSGNHYSNWMAYQAYTTPIPWGNLVHNLEHGAIVIVYNCPQGCSDEVARAQAWMSALPADAAGCAKNRIILAPDPDLPVRFAASAWLWTLKADCFDEAAFTQFYADHYSKAPETICGDGLDTATCP
jgi:hypothetical protein